MEAEVDVGIYPGLLSCLIEAGLSNPGLTGYHSGELLCLTPEAGIISRPPGRPGIDVHSGDQMPVLILSLTEKICYLLSPHRKILKCAL